jgi:hypothetical protein
MVIIMTTNNNIVDEISVRELIKLLLEQPMHNIIIIRDKDGNKVEKVSINISESQRLGCLFG